MMGSSTVTRQNRFIQILLGILLLSVIITLIVFCTSRTEENITNLPQQVHLSLGPSSDAIMVTWTTEQEYVSSPMVIYKPLNHSTSLTASGESKAFTVGSSRTVFIHRVMLSRLSSGTNYTYKVGDGIEEHFSPVFTFKTFASDPDWKPRIVFFADMSPSSPTIATVASRVEMGFYDAVFHLGDLAYNLEDDDGNRGDEFMKQMQPVASRVPFLTIPGNHEKFENFSHYNARYSMWDTDTQQFNNFFWTQQIGPIHVIGITTEFYFFTQYGTIQIANQYTWLEKQLESVDRRKTPWVIVVGHRPLYCTTDPFRCGAGSEGFTLRYGMNSSYGLEYLFEKYKVDLYLAGHEHDYERLWPIRHDRVVNGTVNPSNPYEETEGTIYIVSGTGGKYDYYDEKEVIDDIMKWAKPFESDQKVIIDYEYSYSLLTVEEKDTIRFQQLSSVRRSHVIDEFIMKKRLDIQ